jgi:hypothetical protein
VVWVGEHPTPLSLASFSFSVSFLDPGEWVTSLANWLSVPLMTPQSNLRPTRGCDIGPGERPFFAFCLSFYYFDAKT